MVIPKLPKLEPWVRFPSPAPLSRQCWPMRANDLPLAVPSNKFADVRWHWLWFHTQSCPYDRVRPTAAAREWQLWECSDSLTKATIYCSDRLLSACGV